MGNFFQNYFHGKPGKMDFTESNLPATRWELFWDVMRTRIASVFLLNLIYVLVWVPTILWTLMNAATFYEMAATNSDLLAAGEGIGLVNLYMLVLIPCIFITGPCTAGCTYVCRNWTRDEHAFVWQDFKDGVKANWKQGFVVSLITSVLPFMTYNGYLVYSGMAVNSAFFYIPMVLLLMVVIVWLMSLQVVYTMMVTYKLSIKNLLRNSLIMAVAKFPQALVIRLSTWVVPLIAFAVMMLAPGTTVYAILILVAYYLFFGLGFNRMIYAAFANALCEKYINTKIEGAATNIGLRTSNPDDEIEYLPEDDE